MAIFLKLVNEAAAAGIRIIEMSMESGAKGLIKGNKIAINSSIGTLTEKTCIIAEELGHFYTSAGDILDQSKPYNRKLERRGREWSYNYLIPLQRIIDAHRANARGRHEIAEHIGVTEEFLQNAIDRYTHKYGLCVVVDEQYTILFDPLAVVDRFI